MRARIVDTAARLLRAHGVDGVSVSTLMREAGLTHGGFYNHFESRDELVAAAVGAAAEATSAGAWGPGRSLAEALDDYLSEGHAAHPEQGCVVAALGCDGARQKGAVRHAFARAARGLMRHVDEKLHPQKATKRLSDEALRVTSQAVGALVLARLVDDPALARRLLQAGRAGGADVPAK